MNERTSSEIISIPEFSSESLSKRIENKSTSVDISMRLMSLNPARLHRDVDAVRVGPGRSHHTPGAGGVGEMSVERHLEPELSRDLRVVVEHRHRLRSVSSISLEESVDGHVCSTIVSHRSRRERKQDKLYCDP